MATKSNRKCGACLKDIMDNNFITCSIESCKTSFHRDICIGPSLPEDPRNWVCQKCRCNLKKGGDNSNTPVKTSYTSGNVTLRTKNKVIVSNDKSSDAEVSLGTLISEIRLLRQDVSKLTDKVTEMFTSLNECQERLADVEIKTIRSDQRLKLLEVYHTVVQSLLMYCITAWGGASKTHMISIERAQRSVLKVMLGKPFRFPTYLLHQEAAVLTVRQLFRIITLHN
ncbi:uncharacterized protein LOC131843125 [Achroia grisella]|uniref:uncharacterized protein LOC131843125 n=1 Tax=Achroia grisella TaxID=688607 RepID=UPI0027D269D7|nr:uncharacterized protein LOC131843125 [Achroia grisella]